MLLKQAALKLSLVLLQELVKPDTQEVPIQFRLWMETWNSYTQPTLGLKFGIGAKIGAKILKISPGGGCPLSRGGCSPPCPIAGYVPVAQFNIPK